MHWVKENRETSNKISIKTYLLGFVYKSISILGSYISFFT